MCGISKKYLNMESIDRITLELLTNKHQYNKYLSKEDPNKYREYREYLEKIQKYKPQILNLSKRFLENPETQFNLEMNEMFSLFAKTAIRYIELKELENENQYNDGRENENNDDREDTLFGKIDEPSLDKSENMSSYWGKTIKKHNIPKYTMDMFTNNKS